MYALLFLQLDKLDATSKLEDVLKEIGERLKRMPRWKRGNPTS